MVAGPTASLAPAARQVHLVPFMNPDGYTLVTRNNANDVDLNRNSFTDVFPFREPRRCTRPQRSPGSRNEFLRRPESPRCPACTSGALALAVRRAPP
jgi:hypothetical protein